MSVAEYRVKRRILLDGNGSLLRYRLAVDAYAGDRIGQRIRGRGTGGNRLRSAIALRNNDASLIGNFTQCGERCAIG